MKTEDLVRFEVTILGRKIPLKIKVGQENSTQRKIDEVNNKINDFQLKYQKVDSLDSLIMVLLSYVFEQKESNSEDIIKQQLISQMKNIGDQL